MKTPAELFVGSIADMVSAMIEAKVQKEIVFLLEDIGESKYEERMDEIAREHRKEAVKVLSAPTAEAFRAYLLGAIDSMIVEAQAAPGDGDLGRLLALRKIETLIRDTEIAGKTGAA